MISTLLLTLLLVQFIVPHNSFVQTSAGKAPVVAYISRQSPTLDRNPLYMAVANDAAARANRETRRANANDRIVELRKPMGMTLDEDKQGNVFVKSIEPNGRAAKSGVVFEGDVVTMVSATFGEDMWTCRGVGLSRVLSCIQVRNTKPVRLVLEARTPQEETRIRSIIYRPPTDEERRLQALNEQALKEEMLKSDQQLLKKRKGPFGLW